MTDSRVSWRHGVLRVDGDAWIIEDLGSTNGTFLGLQRLDRIEISAECVVRLGNPDDGPVLRCVPQVPAAAAGQAGSPPADHPGTALSASPAPAPRRPGARRAATRASPRPSPPRRATASPRPSPPRRATAPRRASASTPRGTPWRRPPPSRPSRSRRTCCRAWTAGPRRGCRCRPRPCASAAMPDNDVVLSDLNVSRHHAELRKSPTGSYEIVDLGSHNGTFVNGQRVTSQVLTEQDLVSIGNSTFRLKDGELRQFVDDGNITFTAQDLVVKVGGRQGAAGPRHVPDPGEVPARASSAPAARASPRCSAR